MRITAVRVKESMIIMRIPTLFTQNKEKITDKYIYIYARMFISDIFQ